jgi:hypothetical protein
MLQITWYQKLRQLNPKLRVCQFENSKYLPGIYFVDPREGIVDLCATDVGNVPPYPVFDEHSRMIKSGYRRVVHILLQQKLTTRDQVKKIFGSGFFEQRTPRPSSVQMASIHQQWSAMMKEERKRFNILGDAQQVDVQDKTMDKMKQMEIENYNKRNSAALSGDQFVELADDLKKNMPDDKKESLDRAKFEYDKATGKRKAII